MIQLTFFDTLEKKITIDSPTSSTSDHLLLSFSIFQFQSRFESFNFDKITKEISIMKWFSWIRGSVCITSILSEIQCHLLTNRYLANTQDLRA